MIKLRCVGEKIYCPLSGKLKRGDIVSIPDKKIANQLLLDKNSWGKAHENKREKKKKEEEEMKEVIVDENFNGGEI